MNLLLFGPPGAGKGTQSALLQERHDMTHISTGDLFRENIKNKTDLGVKAKAIIDAGNLVPDDITIAMVEDCFSRLDNDFILDGFPRTVAQAEALDRLLEKKNIELGKAIFIHVPHEFLLARLTGRRVCTGCGATFHIEAMPPKVDGVCDKCGEALMQRKDDNAEVIETRLQAYENSTKPVLEYYENTGKYVQVDGTGETESVYSLVKEVLV